MVSPAAGAPGAPGASIPARARDIDAAWITEVLAPRHPGAHATRVDVVEERELTNSHARLRVTYAPRGDAPEALFCKLAPFDDGPGGRRASILATGMGAREARFYRTLTPTITLRVPIAEHADADADGAFVLLLEDLTASACTVSDGTVTVSVDAAADALEELAAFHACYENPARRAADAAWVEPAPPPSTYGTSRLSVALDQFRDRLTPTFARVAEIYVARAADLHALWADGATTVIHGDPHLGNLFDDHGRVGFLDWGMIRVAPAMRDVSYFLNLALSIDDRRTSERSLLRHYLSARAARDAIPIEFDDAWRAHRIHTAYTVPACCQIVTFPNDVSAGRRVFSEAFLARSEAALDDLDVLGALRDAGL